MTDKAFEWPTVSFINKGKAGPEDIDPNEVESSVNSLIDAASKLYPDDPRQAYLIFVIATHFVCYVRRFVVRCSACHRLALRAHLSTEMLMCLAMGKKERSALSMLVGQYVGAKALWERHIERCRQCQAVYSGNKQALCNDGMDHRKRVVALYYELLDAGVDVGSLD